MPTPLDYQRFGLSQDRFDRSGEQFDQNMEFRRQQAAAQAARMAASNGYRDRSMDMQEIGQVARLAPKFLPPQDAMEARQYVGDQLRQRMHGDDFDLDAWNRAAVPSWHPELQQQQEGPPMPAPQSQVAPFMRIGNKMWLNQGQDQYDLSDDPQQQEREAQSISEFSNRQQMAQRAAQQRHMAQMGEPDPFDEAVKRLKGFEQVYGDNPGSLVGDVVREPGGRIMSGYDAEHELAYSPGKWEFDNMQQKDVYREGRIIKLPKAQRAAMMRYLQQLAPDQAGASAAPGQPRLNPAQMLGHIMSQAGAPHSRETLIQALEKAKAQGITDPQHLLPILDEARSGALDNGRQNAAKYLHARTATDQWNAQQRPVPANPIYGSPNMMIPQGY